MEYLKLTTLYVLLLLSISFFTSCGEDVLGCTDPNAANFNSLATMDDGSCVISGCTITAAENFNRDATIEDNSTCVFFRDKFLGSFLGSFECRDFSGLNSETTTFLIEPDPDDINRVFFTIQNEDFEIPTRANVSRNKLELEAIDAPLDVTIEGRERSVLASLQGEVGINGGEDVISGSFFVFVLSAQTEAILVTDLCPISATKN